MVTPFVMHPHIHAYITNVIGIVMFFRSISNTLVGILDATIASELIVHAVPVSGCVVLTTFVLY
jgi:hypothetical protein